MFYPERGAVEEFFKLQFKASINNVSTSKQ